MAAAPSVSGEELPAVRLPLPLAVERRWQARELFQRRVLARDGVAFHIAHRDHEIVEKAALPCRHRRPVAGECDLVLLGAADLPFLGGDLGVLAHAHAGGAIADGRDEKAHIAQVQVGEMIELLAERAGLLELAQPV